MSSVSLRNDTLIEIATFLVRRWSKNDQISVELSTKKTNETRIKEERVLLIPFSDYNGDEFGRYRQFRTAIWYEAMRIEICNKNTFKSLALELFDDDRVNDVEKCVILLQMYTFVGDDLYDENIKHYPGTCNRSESEMFIRDNASYIEY